MSDKEVEDTLETPFDGLLKNLADHFGLELLTYLGDAPELVSCEPMGGEVELVHRLTDRVWKVLLERGEQQIECVYHLEFESSYSAHIGRRLGAYGWGLFEKSGLPVQHIVWYVGEKQPSRWPKDEWHRECTYDMTFDGEPLSQTKWREVWLPGGHEARQFVKEAPSYLLPFAALMDGMELDLLGELQDAILATALPEDQKQELLVMLVFFASRSLAVSQVMEVMDMTVLEKNPFAQYLIDKGIEEGHQQAKKALAVKLSESEHTPAQIAALLEVSEDVVNAWLAGDSVAE